MLKTRRPSTSRDPDRVTQDIYDFLNELANAINRSESAAKPADVEGRSGDMRLVKDEKGTYALELRFKDGWVRSAAGSFAVSSNVAPHGSTQHGIPIYTLPPPEDVVVAHTNTLLFNGIE
jgi:hypothetical protein